VEPGSELRVFVLTFGPGDDPWEKFGHNAIRVIDDSVSGDYHDVAYNWGYFSFENGKLYFAWNFVRGRLIYSMMPDRGPDCIEYYSHALDRSVIQQELNLTPAQKLQLRDALRWTDTDAHRKYRYDYYLDNCSTRVRDVVDGLTGGRLRAMTQHEPSGVTFRWHTRRLIAETPWLYVALQGVLGHPVDRPLSRWDEMFLPFALRDRLREVRVPDPSGSGQLVPLVKEEKELYHSTRPTSPTRPPNTIPWFLAAGLLLSGILLGLGHFVQRKRAARWAFVIVAMPWLLLMAFAGPFLFYAWFCTDHAVTAWNENVFHVSALMLPMPVLLPMLIFGRRRWAQVTRWLTAAVAGIAILGTLLKLLPGFYQVNGDIIALTLPLNLAIAFIAWRLADSLKSPPALAQARGAAVNPAEGNGKAHLQRGSKQRVPPPAQDTLPRENDKPQSP